MTISTEQFIPVLTGTVANDGTGDTLREAFIKVNNNFSNISDVGFDAGNVNVTRSLVLNDYGVPTASGDPGTAGQIVWDSDYIYVCVATDSWKRANISTW